jgi:hypothetical protein
VHPQSKDAASFEKALLFKKYVLLLLLLPLFLLTNAMIGNVVDRNNDLLHEQKT